MEHYIRSETFLLYTNVMLHHYVKTKTDSLPRSTVNSNICRPRFGFGHSFVYAFTELFLCCWADFQCFLLALDLINVRGLGTSALEDNMWFVVFGRKNAKMCSLVDSTGSHLKNFIFLILLKLEAFPLSNLWYFLKLINQHAVQFAFWLCVFFVGL